MTMNDSAYVEEEGGIKGALTRPLGPLPVWVWAVVIVGGYLLYRMLRGGGSSSSSSGGVIAPVTTGGGSGSDDLSGDTAGILVNIQNELANQADQLANQAEDITKQNDIIAKLVAAGKIQEALSQAQENLSQGLYSLNYWQNEINKLNDLKRACTTDSCRSSYTTKIASATTSYNAVKVKIDTYEASVDDLQAQLAAANPTTTQINAPSGANP